MGHAEDLEIIKGSKVLMVGAGGIGCELLKTLALTGFKDIHVIDMDTIEVSNLNRQFLFRKAHVGEPKAKVAREAVLKFCPSVNITAYHANVKDSEFNVEFFQQFNVVLNGLDNLDARRHVNRLCLSAEVPLVESGTTGFLGQVTVHVKGLTECYECYPKPTPKTYPVCTITNTPTKFVHCIVWAKELLFARLFGDRSQATDLNAQSNENTDGSEGGSDDVFVIQEGESLEDYGKKIFDHVFAYNIESALKKEEMWKKRKAPTPLYIKDILGTVDKEVNGTLPSTGCKSNKQTLSAMNLLGLKNPQDIWSVGDNAKVFLKALQLFFEERKEEFRNLTFDKDDQLAVEFVSSAANIRAASFGIPMQSLFEAKGIAGNIIHAVATTNAIIAGLIVIEAVKLLKCDSKSYRMTYCLEHPNRKHLLMPAEPFQPNKTCYVCSKTPISLEINTHEAKLKDLIEKVIKNKLGISSPMIMYGYTILYESDEGLENESTACYMSNSKKTLAEILDPSSNCISIEDLQQDFSCDIHIKHRDDFEEESEGFILSGVNSSSKAETNVNSEGGGENVSTDAELNRNDDSDVECLAGGDLEIVEQSLEAQTVFNAGSSRKRKLDTDSNDDEVVLLIDAHPVPEKRARHQ